jgi:hypothetical protein
VIEVALVVFLVVVVYLALLALTLDLIRQGAKKEE